MDTPEPLVICVAFTSPTYMRAISGFSVRLGYFVRSNLCSTSAAVPLLSKFVRTLCVLLFECARNSCSANRLIVHGLSVDFGLLVVVCCAVFWSTM